MAETKRSELKVACDPRLLAKVEAYCASAGTDLEYGVRDLLEAGLEKLTPRESGVNGKRVRR